MSRLIDKFAAFIHGIASLIRRIALLMHGITSLIRRIASLIRRIASLIMKIMIQAWHITQKQNIKLPLEASSLDEFTRQLPEGYYSTFRTFNGGTRVLGLA